jgi:hypothetical protein
MYILIIRLIKLIYSKWENNRLNEFILESKLELLLEANIEYTDKFKDILRSIDSPISTKLYH